MYKKLKYILPLFIFPTLFLQIFFQTASYSQDLWQYTPQDARRALPNNMAPPARLDPLHKLAPLDPSFVGAIRRVNVSSDQKVVALTFDLCELATVTTGCDLELLGYLHKNNLPATLFMGGKWMRTHQKRTKQLLQDPLFEIANHAWTHGNCTKLSPKGLDAQILWTQAQYELLREEVEADVKNRGQSASFLAVPKLFRPPYARCNRQNLEQIAKLGLKVVLWDVVAETGSVPNQKVAVQKAVAIAKQVKSGSIILFHANLVPKGTALLVREVVPILKSQGYSFVTVSDLLKMGTEERVNDGYFSHPNDNVRYDKDFGIDGTGLARRFTGD